MPIYWGRRLIKNRGDSGVYYGNRKIKFVYFGNQLVYSYESYDPGTVLVDVTNGKNKTVELKPGVYQVYITGGGGTGGTHYAADSVWYTTSGGSGATWEGTFKLNQDTSIEAFGCGNNADSYLNIGGVRMITAGGGRETTWGHSHPEGGTLTLASGWSSYVVTTDKSVNGNNGRTSVQSIPNGGVTASSLKWGEGTKITTDGAVQYGGVKIQYLRRWE